MHLDIEAFTFDLSGGVYFCFVFALLHSFRNLSSCDEASFLWR